MHRKLTDRRVVIASHNPGKLPELAALLAPYGIETIPVSRFTSDEPEETGTTFIENAEIKARAAAEASGMVAFADDSGITVDALDGFPGLKTARFLPTWEEKREEVERRLAGKTDRSAAYNSALTLAWPDGNCESFLGRAPGTLVWPPRGEHPSFDPVFVPEGYDRTYAELGQELKARIDARAKAFAALAEACLTEGETR
jgi:XTP/dITP diphosphohydrolase